MIKHYDHIIIGAGIYGLYSALILSAKKKKVLLIEMEKDSCSRATLVNQARVHNGYHYPRSLSTAIKTASYFDKFSKDFSFAINNKFTQIYSISRKLSYTSAEHFKKSCQNANIPCKEIYKNDILNPDVIEASFETEEYAFDAIKIKKYLIKKLSKYSNTTIKFDAYPIKVTKKDNKFFIKLNSDLIVSTSTVINATYASTNQIATLFGVEKFKIKYEICEIIICDVSKNLKNIGVTIMDGPFFSLMPFGLTGHHSITTVSSTPHKESYEILPTFDCQNKKVKCTPSLLSNCNNCPNKPKTSWMYMNQLAQKYLLNTKIKYLQSYFAIKPILKTSEVDDSRPTVMVESSSEPKFISILSGKINTIYDLDKILC